MCIGKWKETKIGRRKWKFKYISYRKNKPFKGNVKRISGRQKALKIGKDHYALIYSGRRY